MSTDLAVVLLPEVLLPDLLHHVLIDIVGEVQRLPLGFKGTLERRIRARDNVEDTDRQAVAADISIESGGKRGGEDGLVIHLQGPQQPGVLPQEVLLVVTVQSEVSWRYSQSQLYSSAL